MSEKKKARARFAVGDAVRVRSGITDPDFPIFRWAAGPERSPRSSKVIRRFTSFGGARRH
jgi:hypothetical protein